MKIYSHNIWNYNPHGFGYEPLWQRMKLISELIFEADADVCMFQECGPFTCRVGEGAIQKLLEEKYSEVCPDKADVNYTPVFYKKEKFDLVDSGWVLYEGFNDGNSKSITWAVLQDKVALKKTAVLSTHFWWKFDTKEDFNQRIENALQLKNLCDEIYNKYGTGAIIGGDFNNGFGADQGDEPYRKMLDMGFGDIRLSADVTTNCLTHHDLPVIDDKGVFQKGNMPTRTLDHIFTYHSVAKALKFGVLTSDKALTSSDHCPLIGEFDL